MNETQSHPAIPTLEYFEAQGEDARYLLRLVLLVAAIHALASAATYLVKLCSEISSSSFLLFAGGQRTLDLVVLLGYEGSCLFLVAACLLCFAGRRTRALAFWAAVIQVFVRVSLLGVAMVEFSTMYRNGGFSRSEILTMVGQFVFGELAGAILPIALIFLLRRPRVRQMIGG